jgi:pimeloyl-ACP methyl ester carboxylesterase
VLAGHSLGGGVCLEMMRSLGADSRLVSRLVLVNTVCYPQGLPWFMMALCVPRLPGLVMNLIPEQWGFRLLERWMYHPRNGMKPAAAREYAERLQSPGAHEALIAVAKGIAPKDIDALVASYIGIAVPTLILWGKQDRVVPFRLAKRLAADIAGSTLCPVEPCGHCPQEEKPDETLMHIRRFIAEGRLAG